MNDEQNQGTGRPALVCRQCGGPRKPGSGKRCRHCYLFNAADRRSGTELGQLGAILRGLEDEGRLVQTPDGWTLPEWRKTNA